MKEYCVRRTSNNQWEATIEAQSINDAARKFAQSLENLCADDSILVTENVSVAAESKTIPFTEIFTDIAKSAQSATPLSKNPHTATRFNNQQEQTLHKLRDHSAYGPLRRVVSALNAIGFMLIALAGFISFGFAINAQFIPNPSPFFVLVSTVVSLAVNYLVFTIITLLIDIADAQLKHLNNHTPANK
ncbi:hypothetical protein [Persicirhabdus sediminis]|uniref:Uncharacterized protein n=1 Tax=Persicirhabdus sediminis TaxID=454144 RepID=A0A8J7SH29_9BACT|nr:hypothetical protein [Persicirhabdus sediminis]MBK1789596.1 hypothetical protein [Persicirhabdus sediminis]